MKVLIDCGAYTGDSLPVLINLFGPFQRIVCFEANPGLTVLQPEDTEAAVEIHQSAVWTKNTNLQFFFGEHDEQSSLMENKSTGNFSHERSAKVTAIDLAEWLQNNTGPDDDLTIKMDIEGAEFDVLERLAGHPVRTRIEHLLVEWHNNRLRPRWRYRVRRRLLELRYWLMNKPIRIWSGKKIRQMESSIT